MPSGRDVLKISVRMGAISLWSSLRMRGEILSGPAAFPGFNLRSCLDTPETDIAMFCIGGELSCLVSTSSARCRSFRGTSLDVVNNIINIDKKKKWSKNRALWDASKN